MGNSARVVQIVDHCRLTSKRETISGRLPIYIELSVKISILLFCTERRVKQAVSQYMHSEAEYGDGQCWVKFSVEDIQYTNCYRP